MNKVHISPRNPERPLPGSRQGRGFRVSSFGRLSQSFFVQQPPHGHTPKQDFLSHSSELCRGSDALSAGGLRDAKSCCLGVPQTDLDLRGWGASFLWKVRFRGTCSAQPPNSAWRVRLSVVKARISPGSGSYQDGPQFRSFWPARWIVVCHSNDGPCYLGCCQVQQLPQPSSLKVQSPPCDHRFPANLWAFSPPAL